VRSCAEQDKQGTHYDFAGARFIVCLGALVLLFTDHSFARAAELMDELEF
jgi:hypothetical protein